MLAENAAELPELFAELPELFADLQWGLVALRRMSDQVDMMIAENRDGGAISARPAFTSSRHWPRTPNGWSTS